MTTKCTLAALLALLTLALSCSKSTDSNTNKPLDNGLIGVLLSGNGGDNAVGQTVNFMAAMPPAILSDTTGLVANKIFVVISPSATVGQVNNLLDSLHARIICMDDASVFLTLSVPAVSAVQDIENLTSRLAESEPFLFAFPCYVPIPPAPAEPDPEMAPKDIPGDPAGANIAHLKACYMPAAWNANSRASQVNNRVTVLVPDAYARLTPHAELPGQEFVAIQGDGADIRYDAHTNTALGNHGFYVSGILGARFDDIGATGIHPGNSNLIRIRSINVGSEEWGAKLQQIADAIPSTSQTVVSTSLGYNDPTFSNVSKWERILLALKWRELVGDKQTQFVHATSSGNDGRVPGEGSLAVYNSPFTMAAQMVSPWDWLGAGEYTAADSLGYVQLQQLYATTKPYILQPLVNTLVVGSSNLNGTRSAFSNVGAEIRFVGVRVFSPCVTNDATCIDGFGTPSGTSMATPQAAGLVAYMMNLKGTLTPIQAKQFLLSAYDNSRGIVNSYKAVLALDDGLSNADVRKAILNVADTAAGTFDEKDIEAFLNVIDEPQYTKDYSRFDLNGDGWTGGTTAAAFDLNANTPPEYTSVSPPNCTDTSFDETAVTDRDILYYYAHSSLYSGSARVRDSLLPCGAQVTAMGSEYTSSAYVRTEQVISWQPAMQTDTTIREQHFSGGTEGASPVDVHAAATAPCASATFFADAKAELNWYVASGDLITGVSATAQTEETDQTPVDSNCYTGYSSAGASVIAGFVVKGGTVAFSATGTLSGGSSAQMMVRFGGPTGMIIDFEDISQSVSTSGELPPGEYWLDVRSNYNATASITITFSPL